MFSIDPSVTDKHRAQQTKTVIGFVDSFQLSRDCFLHSLRQDGDIGEDIVPFASFEEALAAPLRFSLIVLYAHQNTADVTRAALEALDDTALRLLIVSDENSADLWTFFSEVMPSRVCGFVSTADTEFRTLNAAIAFARSGGSFIPPSLLTQAYEPAESRPRTAPRPREPFTARQKEVLAKLREGKPNKLIAFELGMSESTVKIHIRNIMRVVGATNRTQVAFRTNADLAP